MKRRQKVLQLNYLFQNAKTCSGQSLSYWSCSAGPVSNNIPFLSNSMYGKFPVLYTILLMYFITLQVNIVLIVALKFFCFA